MYILRWADDSLSVGSTWDLERRVAQHNEGVAAEYTRNRLPVHLVYCEWDLSIETVFRREKQVQGWGRAKRLALIAGDLASLRPLSRKPPRSKA